MNIDNAFRLEGLETRYWAAKCIADGLILAFAIVVASVSNAPLQSNDLELCAQNETRAENCGLLTSFRIVCFTFAVLVLSTSYVQSTELAFAIRKAVLRNKQVPFIRGSNLLPVTSFQKLHCECRSNPSPNYLCRLLGCMINGPCFMFLPIYLVVGGQHRLEFYQWLTFAPSVALPGVLSLALFMLIVQSQEPLDVFLATIASMLYSGIGDRLVLIGYSRSDSIGSAMKVYTRPQQGISVFVARVLKMLRERREVTIEWLGEDEFAFLRANDSEMVQILVACLRELPNLGGAIISLDTERRSVFRRVAYDKIKDLFMQLQRHKVTLYVSRKDLNFYEDKELGEDLVDYNVTVKLFEKN